MIKAEFPLTTLSDYPWPDLPVVPASENLQRMGFPRGRRSDDPRALRSAQVGPHRIQHQPCAIRVGEKRRGQSQIVGTREGCQWPQNPGGAGHGDHRLRPGVPGDDAEAVSCARGGDAPDVSAAGNRRGDGQTQQQPAGGLPHRRGARPGPRLRTHVRVRQRGCRS